MYTFSHRRVKKLIPVWMYNPLGQEFKKEILDKAFLESTISVLMPARLFHPLFQIRKSPIHGQGAFSVRHIAEGTRIIEYVGERITHEAADARYRDDPVEHTTTFLFTVDEDTVIDATCQGNDARYINHCCDPNCEAIEEDGRIFIEAIREIPLGAELVYDYQLELKEDYPVRWRELYACGCRALACRGSLLYQGRD